MNSTTTIKYFPSGDLEAGREVHQGGVNIVAKPKARQHGSTKKSKKGINGTDSETATDSLPPNAVDKDGNIVPVDFFCRNGNIVEATGGIIFDYVVASHVIEHTPNLLQFYFLLQKMLFGLLKNRSFPNSLFQSFFS